MVEEQMKRSWKKCRQTTQYPDAERRWDQAYQLLLQWNNFSKLPLLPISQPMEVKDENSNLCESLNPKAEPVTNN